MFGRRRKNWGRGNGRFRSDSVQSVALTSVPDYDDAILAVAMPHHYSWANGMMAFFNARTFEYISCAEAGWPDVQFGEQVEEASPDWLKRYLAAKRSVEAKLASTNKLRPIIYRPSLIWDWKKFDVLPVIPVFNIASALGVPFVDKTVRVEDLGKAIVAGLVDAEVSGVQRFPQIESLAEAL